jgi:hypothetical protein
MINRVTINAAPLASTINHKDADRIRSASFIYIELMLGNKDRNTHERMCYTCVLAIFWVSANIEIMVATSLRTFSVDTIYANSDTILEFLRGS